MQLPKWLEALCRKKIGVQENGCTGKIWPSCGWAFGLSWQGNWKSNGYKSSCVQRLVNYSAFIRTTVQNSMKTTRQIGPPMLFLYQAMPHNAWNFSSLFEMGAPWTIFLLGFYFIVSVFLFVFYWLWHLFCIQSHAHDQTGSNAEVIWLCTPPFCFCFPLCLEVRHTVSVL